MHRARKEKKTSKKGGSRRAPNNNGIVPLPRSNAMVVVQGENQPQAFPYTPGSMVMRKVFRYTDKLKSDATGSFLYRFSLRNLSRAINGAGIYSDAVNIANSFDAYKPVRFRLNLVPSFAVSTFSVPSVLLAPDYEDLDQTQVISTLEAANQYADRVVIDPRKASLTTFKIPTLQSGSVPGTISTSPAVIQSGGFLDFKAPPLDGVVYAVGVGFPLSLNVFDAFLEMDCLLRFSR